MAIVEDFINKFHNLEGISLKERKKSLHYFLISVKALSSHFLDTLIQTLIPATYLEETFRIELLIYFKRTTELLDILMSGEEIGAYKVLKQHWFVQKIMEKYSPLQFVEEVVPKLALTVRTKVFKKILVHIKDENKVENLFEELHRVYGFNISSVLLPGCSSNKIKECLLKHSIHFSASQLKLLFDKDQSLIIVYFEELSNHGRDVANFKWVSFFHYMGIKDPVFYFELTKNFRLYMHQLGRKSTKKFIDSQKKNILEKPRDYIDFLRKDSLVRKLGDDFPELYRKILPKCLSNFEYRMAKSLIKFYNKDKQYELYYKTFEEVYNESLWDNIHYMDERLIEFVPDRSERNKWIAKFEKRGNIKKYNARKKYARYQSVMTFMDDGKFAVKERKTIFNTLISTCKLTKDYDAFLNILKSFCQRHRNSDVTILYNFLRTVYKELDMKKLEIKHWKYIYEIVEIQLFKKQQIFYPILVEYIKFLYLRNEAIEKYVTILLNEAPSDLSDFEYGIDEFQKKMLEFYVKLLPEINDEKNIAIQVALSVMRWNQKHPTDKIFISKQQNILYSVMKLCHIEKIDPDAMKIFKYLICEQDGNQEISDLDKIYWDNFKNLSDDTITRWFVKHKPIVFKKNLDKIGIMLKANNSQLVHTLKKYDHIDIASTITTLCYRELKNCSPYKRNNILRILVLFLQPDELLIFLKKYSPERCKCNVTIGEDEKRSQLEIQCALVRYLKLTVNLKKFLPDLLKYCQGDILASGLPSLYSSFCRIPENQLCFALEELNPQAVSVRKHSIFLSSLILPVDKVLLKYKQIETSENNASVRQHMFLSCYKYFLKNSLQECWTIMALYIEKLKKEQKDIIKLLINVDKVPKQYRSIFTEHAWKTFERLKTENVKLDDNMTSLLRNLSKEDVINLQDEFCIEVIENKLFDSENCSMEHWVFDFARKFLLYGENTEKKINIIFKVLHNFKKSGIENKKNIEVLKIVNQFCFALFEDFLGDKKDEINKSFPKLYRDAWVKEFTLEETFEENLMIDFLLFKTDPKVVTESLPKQMNKSFSDALGKYGNLITNNFKNFLSSTLDLICKGDDGDLQRINFLNNFLEINCSSEHCILVIELLTPPEYIEYAESEYKNLIKKLLQKDEIVKIRLFGKLKSESY